MTIGTVLLCLLGVIVLLLLAAVVNALRIKKTVSGAPSPLEFTPEEEANYAETLSQMVQVPTVSLRGRHDLTEFHRLHEVLRARFPRIAKELEWTELEGNLLLRWRGRDSSRDAILLMGHQDVVTAEEREWTDDPFSGAIKEGKIWGRGAMDCKCTVMGEWQAVEELLAEGFVPPCDVYLASSIDEEISGTGAPMTVEYLKNKGIRLAAVMDEGGGISGNVMPGLEGKCGVIGVVEKGYADLKIVARGSGGHSSTPPRHTPLARLADFVSEVERRQPFKKAMTTPVVAMFRAMAPYMSFPMRLLFGNLWLFKPLITRVMPAVSPHGGALVNTTFVFTMCGGSQTPNVIPDEAYVVCNLRTALHQNAAESIAVIEKYARKHDLTVEVLESRDASSAVDTDGEEYRFLAGCVRECFPDVVVAPYYVSGGTDCRNYDAVSSNCLRFSPVYMNPQQLGAMHAANENIDTDALARSVKFYKYYLKNHR